MDNAGCHRAKKVQRLLREQAGRLEPFWLPPYSPELNLIGYAWGNLKETATDNCFFGDVERMENAVAQARCQLNSSTHSPLQLHFKSLEGFRGTA